MKVGAIKDYSDTAPSRRRARVMSGINGGLSGGNTGGNGGGDSNNDGPPDYLTSRPDKSRVVTWFVLLVVLMTFGGLIGAYIVVATNGQSEWRPFDLPRQLWLSTALLALSSIAIQTAKAALDRGEQLKAKRWILFTTALGAAFVSSQMVAWLVLVSRGLYLAGNPYSGFFYILTAVHAAHVLGGLVALGAIQLRAWYPTLDDGELVHRQNLSRSVTIYWHFLGVLWVALLGLLAFWR